MWFFFCNLYLLLLRAVDDVLSSPTRLLLPLLLLRRLLYDCATRDTDKPEIKPESVSLRVCTAVFFTDSESGKLKSGYCRDTRRAVFVGCLTLTYWLVDSFLCVCVCGNT